MLTVFNGVLVSETLSFFINIVHKLRKTKPLTELKLVPGPEAFFEGPAHNAAYK